MMEYTDRHMRYLLRLMTARTVLWTEMVPAPTINHNQDDLGRFLDYNEDVEHPVVLQVRVTSTPLKTICSSNSAFVLVIAASVV